MKTTVNERITQIISQFGYKSKRSFAEKIGIAQTSLNDIRFRLKGGQNAPFFYFTPIGYKSIYYKPNRLIFNVFK